MSKSTIYSQACNKVAGFQSIGQEFIRELVIDSKAKPTKLPVVLSKEEVKRLLNAPEHIKERVLFGFIYDTGVRIDELVNLLISDVDLDRKQVHIRKTKNKYERYVTMSTHAVRGIKKHILLNNPKDYLFESSVRKGIPMHCTDERKLVFLF